MMRALVQIGVLSAVFSAGAALADDTWHGIWTADPAWCAQADRIGSVTPAPVALSATEFRGYENTCQVTTTQRVGDMYAWRLVLTCQSEGSEYDEELLVITPDPDTLWFFRGGEPVHFTRCPR